MLYSLYFCSASTLEDWIMQVRSQIDPLLPRNLVNITRHNVIDGIFNALARDNFVPTAGLDVQFVSGFDTTEEAVDLGGPTREMLDLGMEALKKLPIWDEVEDGLIIRRNEECMYCF